MSKDFWDNTDERNLDGHNLPEGTGSLTSLAGADDIATMTKKDVNRLKEIYKGILDTAERAPAEIENDAIYNRFTTLVGQCKTAQDDREATKKKLKDPYNKASTAIENEFKLLDGENNLHKDLEDTFNSLKKRMSVFDTKRYEAEETKRREEQAKLVANAAADGIEIDPDACSPTKLGTQKSEYGGTSVRSIVDAWEVIDETLLPRSVLTLDPKKVEQLIKNGATEIPGIKISKKVDTTVRRK